jgi:hypothetical protein
MKFKAPKVKVKDTISASHHPTKKGGPISVSSKKPKITKVAATSTDKTRVGLGKFKNLMRYLKSK